MKKLSFSIQINASKVDVWNTLWNKETFQIWANIIDEGTYLVGEMKQGNEVQFISSVNGYWVTSLIEKLLPYQYVSFRHGEDTKELGTKKRDKEWTGGVESYTLTEINGVTTLQIESDIPSELENYFELKLPKVLEQIKLLAEMRK